MNELAKLQKLMAEALLSNRADTDFKLLDKLNKNSKISPKKQIQIYRETIRSNHLSALKDTFPAVCKLVGEGYFKQISSDFFSTHPSQSSDLNEYGEEFPSYLEELIIKREEAKELVYLPDTARLEWLWYCLDTSPESQELHLSSIYPIHLIWEIALENTDTEITLDSAQIHLKLWREGSKKKICTIDKS